MLTERFIASIGVPEKVPTTNIIKDAGIFIHEFQPLNQQRAVLKKSATAPNYLAVSESHIFAAQTGRSVVHVYSREKGNHEATVPFTERITCITLVCDDTVLALGTAEGRIFLWEVATGRQVTTSQAHLQAVTVLVAEPASNFLLSGSADSTVHVWSVAGLLSFANTGTQDLTPLRTFTSHRAEVTALAVGHSSSFSNFAVSASKDQTCLIWDSHTGNVLRTYLLPALPTCLTLDAADRAVYLGYEDGSLQQLDLYSSSDDSHATLRAVQADAESTAALQPPESSRWRSPETSKGAVHSLSLSFDSCTLISGHQSGMIMAWDVATGRAQANFLQNPLPGPVTNLAFLPVTGFATEAIPAIRVPMVVKPKFGAFDSSNGTVPGNYALNVELCSTSKIPAARDGKPQSSFQQALTVSTFSSDLLDEGLAELASWNNRTLPTANGQVEGESDDFMALDGGETETQQPSLEKQNAALKAQLDAMRRLQTASFDKIEKLDGERKALLRQEQDRLRKRGAARTNGVGGALSSSEDESMADDD
ncbi:Pre-rRNA-processing protein ipi3 [Recurvomyces mirabilis]|nr:Pre-rRNA-processing protein ipi3 [Recurvomyces mirabilis]